jgi:TPR repeat protein
MKAEYVEKQKEYEAKKARAKALQLRLTCTICGAKPKTLLNCPCGTTQCVPAHERVGGGALARDATRLRYCSTECQRIDWRDRGHRKACKKIRNERAAEAAQAEAPTPPKEIFYGPAPRSHADEVRARIAAEHEAARLLREANPEREPLSARMGSRCPICMEDWDVNVPGTLIACCCRMVCQPCFAKFGEECPLCRAPRTRTPAQYLARMRRHVEKEVPEAMCALGDCYHMGVYGLMKSAKKAAKLYKRAAELGSSEAMMHLGLLYANGADGVKQDRKKAVQLYRRAADRGHAVAQYNLGQQLRDEGSLEESVVYYTRSAQQGCTLAEYNLGVAYWQGVGVERDLDEGTRWMKRAAAKGDEDAVEALRRVLGK